MSLRLDAFGGKSTLSLTCEAPDHPTAAVTQFGYWESARGENPVELLERAIAFDWCIHPSVLCPMCRESRERERAEERK